ncbi:hypothetical protein ACA910_021679 [Epithemia clementina (nom. ined.)]
MNRPISKRDPPSAASIVVSNEDTPTFSLNARQLELLSSRGRATKVEHDDEGGQRPFVTRSNTQGGVNDHSAQAESKETRSLFAGSYARSRHSLVSGSHTRRSATADDGGLLRRILEQANHNSRQSTQNRLSSQSTELSSDKNRRTQKQSEISAQRIDIRRPINARAKKEPEDTSIRREDPDEVKNSYAQHQTAGDGSQKVDRVIAIREHFPHGGVEEESERYSGNGDDGDEGKASEVVDVRRKDVGKSFSTMTREDINMVDSNPKQVDQEEQNMSEMKSVASSVRRKLEDKKRLAHAKSKPKGIVSTTNVTERQTRAKEHDLSGNEKTRQLIQEKMRKRKGIAGRSRDTGPPDDGFESFCRTLQLEATMSNSQLWASFSALMEGKSPPVLTSKKLAKGYKFDSGTRQMLSVMNMYLRGMDHVDYRNETQLVNDKTLEKQMSRNGQSFLRAAPFHSRFVAKRSATRKKEHKVKSFMDPAQKHHREQKESVEIERSPSKTENSPQPLRTPTRRDEVIAAAKMSLNNVKAGIITTEMAQSTQSTEMPLTQGLEMALGDFENNARTKKIVQKGPGLVWTKVKLRSVTDTVPGESSTENQPAWASVTLRKVPHNILHEEGKIKQRDDTFGDETDETTIGSKTGDTENEEGGLSNTDQSNTTTITSAAMLNPKELGHHNRENTLQDHNIKISKTGSESIKKNKKTDHYWKDEPVVFKLRPEKSSKNERRIVIGNKVIMLVASTESDRPPDVVWQAPMENIQPVAFDVPNQLVKLVCHGSSEEKELHFSKPADCIQFMNLFYQGQNSDGKFSFQADEPTGNSADDDFASLRMECVNDEERSLLQKFRLMTKDAREALQETITHEEPGPKKHPSLDILTQIVSAKGAGNNGPSLGKNLPEFISTAEMPASPVSTFSASVNLSDADLEKAKVYQKLLKVGVPPEGVLDKMQKDNIDPRIISFVLGEQEMHNEGNLSEDETKIASKYQKMLSIGLPMDAVRHKMIQDQVPSKIIDFVVSDGSAGGTHAKGDDLDKLTDAEEEIATKYRKMMKIGLEADAVRHRMMKDQISEKIVSSVLGKADFSNSNETLIVPGQVQQTTNSKPDMSQEETSLAQQYKRLLKLQIPRDQLESRMRHEGASEKVISFVLGTKSGDNSKDNQTSSSAQGSNLVSLHWTPLSGDQLDNSVWKAAKALKTEEDADPSKLVELFQKKPKNSKPAKSAGSDDAGSGGAKARLIDLNRSNNVAISLKSFKDFSYDELADIIMFLDPCRKLEGERIPFLRDLLPTQTEIKAVSEYEGPNDRLVPAEKWFRRIANIKRIDVKVKVMRTMEMLKVEAREVGENLRLFTRVCNQVMDSEKLQDLLAMVLLIGNMLNEGTRTGRAAGFKFDSLLKLTQTKSTDGTTTVLDYLVTLYAGKGERDTLNIIEDFPECQTASRMLLSDLTMEVKSIQESLEQCKAELNELKKDASRRKAQVLQPGSAPGSVVMSSPGHGIGQNSTGDEGKPQHKWCSIRQNGDESGSCVPAVFTEISRYESADKNSIYGGIERLQSFIENAEVSVSDLEHLKVEALAAAQELSKFGGEGRNTGATSTLLDILFQFSSNLESALKKYDDKCAAEAKRKKAKSGVVDSESTQESRSQTTSDGGGSEEESLVLMVNKMLKYANESTREDFRKGRFIHNPTTEMKAIYKRETQAKSERGGRDLAAVIKEKSEGVDLGEVQDVRSKFGSPRAPPAPECILPNPPILASQNSESTEGRSPVNSTASSVQDKEEKVNGASTSVLSAVKKFEGRPCPEHRPLARRQLRKVETSVSSVVSDNFHWGHGDYRRKERTPTHMETDRDSTPSVLESASSEDLGQVVYNDASLSENSFAGCEGESPILSTQRHLETDQVAHIDHSENLEQKIFKSPQEVYEKSFVDSVDNQEEKIESPNAAAKISQDEINQSSNPVVKPSEEPTIEHERKLVLLSKQTDRAQESVETPETLQLQTEAVDKTRSVHNEQVEQHMKENEREENHAMEVSNEETSKGRGDPIEKRDSVAPKDEKDMDAEAETEPRVENSPSLKHDENEKQGYKQQDESDVSSKSSGDVENKVDVASKAPLDKDDRQETHEGNLKRLDSAGETPVEEAAGEHTDAHFSMDPKKSEDDGPSDDPVHRNGKRSHLENPLPSHHNLQQPEENVGNRTLACGTQNETSPVEQRFDLSGSAQRLSLARENSPLRERFLASKPRLSDYNSMPNRRGSTGQATGITEKARIRRTRKSPGRRDTEGTTMSAPSVLQHEHGREYPEINRNKLALSSNPKNLGRPPAIAESPRSTFERLARQRRMEKHDLKDTRSVSSTKSAPVSQNDGTNNTNENGLNEATIEAPTTESILPPNKMTLFERRARELREAKKNLGT